MRYDHIDRFSNQFQKKDQAATLDDVLELTETLIDHSLVKRVQPTAEEENREPHFYFEEELQKLITALLIEDSTIITLDVEYAGVHGFKRDETMNMARKRQIAEALAIHLNCLKLIVFIVDIHAELRYYLL